MITMANMTLDFIITEIRNTFAEPLSVDLVLVMIMNVLFWKASSVMRERRMPRLMGIVIPQPELGRSTPTLGRRRSTMEWHLG